MGFVSLQRMIWHTFDQGAHDVGDVKQVGSCA